MRLEELRRVEIRERVIPVDKTGLHCGAWSLAYGRNLLRVIPVDKTGLHCGMTVVAPPFSTIHGDPGR